MQTSKIEFDGLESHTNFDTTSATDDIIFYTPQNIEIFSEDNTLNYEPSTRSNLEYFNLKTLNKRNESTPNIVSTGFSDQIFNVAKNEKKTITTGNFAKVLNFSETIPTIKENASKSSKNVDDWISKLLKLESLSEMEIETMCTMLKENLSSEQNCVYLSTPLTIAGDIHGQLHDLIELFRIGGLPPDTNYLFLGDYVDRGYYSCETFCLIASFRLRFPTKVTILRGNHESRHTTQVYGFYDECLKKYGNTNVWRLFTDAFDSLPVAAIIDNKIFCDHGGISEETLAIDNIQSLNRFQETPQEGTICDLLWSDPYDHKIDEEPFYGCTPSPRGAGVLFSQQITDSFLHHNNLQCICRAHQLTIQGHDWKHNDKVVTVFSAPNYCYRCGNCASVMVVDEHLNKDFIDFNSAPSRSLSAKTRFAPDYFL